jgi:hypothetical protein
MLLGIYPKAIEVVDVKYVQIIEPTAKPFARRSP